MIAFQCSILVTLNQPKMIEIIGEKLAAFSVIFMGGQTICVASLFNSVLICSLQTKETYDPCDPSCSN